MGRGRRVADLCAVIAAGIGATLLFGLVGLPSPTLFAGLLVGLVRALTVRGPDRGNIPRPATTAAQVIIGVSMGSLIDLETLRTVGENWLPVLGVTVGTLALSLGAGLLLRLQRGISPVTGGVLDDRRGRVRDRRDGPGAGRRRPDGRRPPVPAGAADRRPHAGRRDRGSRRLPRQRLGPLSPSTIGPGCPVGLLFTVGCGVVGLVIGRLLRLPGGPRSSAR